MLSVVVAALALLAVVACLVIQAVYQEYLVVLRWPKRGTFILERDDQGRYQIVSAPLLPLTLVRFAGWLGASLLRAVRGWVAARAAGRLTASVGAKI